MNLYLVIVAVVPLVVAAGSSSRVRMALALTIGASWGVALLGYERLVPDRDEISDVILFFLVYVHIIIAPTAGTIASMTVPRSKGLILPALGSILGSATAVALHHLLPFLLGSSERLSRALDVMGPVVFGSTLAVLVAAINKKPAPTPPA